ncbi:MULTISPECIES: esterase-like activity of phytase family protein [unclassified Sinorhizobium]|uniref:esterase-like activity of phytase family protein n=1 Tax=unclassified Sinorhizobium TaxID=2613772 RepID=UPI0024C3FA92|nr:MULTISPECIES: esterase-like activity of phytase family protein [unclassified Sinorhizobium]MDK1374753.1 esterase-like activity of phytase family protein [Sinorhizobium sp. 6-70]MDK1479064.1 esterase-like activity of phytase family protein [Sinorhizobium sp. 6-117]
MGTYAAEIGETFEKPCPFGDCSAGIAFTYLGQTVIPTGYSEAGVEFGGISGLDFDTATGRFIALSDDRAERGPVRVYELDVDVSAHGLQGVSVLRHIPLRDVGDKPFTPQSVDPEALRLGAEGLYWTSEEGGKARLPPSVRVSSSDGVHLREFSLLDDFAPTADGSSGIRDHLAFESLAILPSGDVLVALEAALQQDGPKPSLTESSPARVVQFDAISGKPKAQYVYMISPIPQAGAEGEKAMTGLSEMLSLGDGRVLMIERSFAEGAGNTIKIFMVDLASGTDVSDIDSLAEHDGHVVPFLKTEVLDLNGIGLSPDNIEAMAIGKARDGTEILLLAADNNFSPRQKTQFFAFKIVRRGQ